MADDIYDQNIDPNKEPNVSQFGEFDEQTKTELQELVDEAKKNRDEAVEAQQRSCACAARAESAATSADEDAATTQKAALEAKKLLDEAKALALASVYTLKKAQNQDGIYGISPVDASVHDVTMMAVSTEFNMTPYQETENKARVVTLILRQGTGANKATWDAKIHWPDNTPPILSIEAGRVDIFQLLTTDGGVTWFGAMGRGWYK